MLASQLKRGVRQSLASLMAGLSRCVLMATVVAWVGCAARQVTRPVSADMWEREGCFSGTTPDPREFETSSLEGVVFTAGYGPREFPVPVAVVHVWHKAKGDIVRAMADAEGRFSVTGLPDGRYEMGVCANGWRSWRGTVRLSRASPADRLDVPLELGK